MIEKYRDVPYVKQGRTISDGLDCWGLVRLVRLELTQQELTSYDNIDPLDKRNLTKSYIECVRDFNLKESVIKEGAIACGFYGNLCHHVGFVVKVNNKLMVLETDEKTGVIVVPISKFESRYNKVKYYD